MYKVLSGREPAAAIIEEERKKVASMGRKPHLAIVLAGDDPASEVYVRKKMEKAAAIGVRATLRKLGADVKEGEIIATVRELNLDRDIDGFIVQSPIPKHINYSNVVEAIDPGKDVDGWTSANMGRMFLGVADPFMPATPIGIIRLLEYYGVELKGKDATVVGRGNVVGKPLSFMLLERDATVTICHSKTGDLARHTKGADIVIAAAGSPKILKADMVKEGAYVVDVGTTRVEGKIVGDVDYENVSKKAHCTPVPGGVGPMTVAMLIRNVVEAAARRS